MLPFPEGGGGNVSEAKFWPYIESLSADDWSHAFGYLYRDWPVIDSFLPYEDDKAARKSGAVKYIDRFSEAFTRDSILHRHGSGKYHIDFNDTNKKHEATVCRVFFTINEDGSPPQIDPATLLIGHPDNRMYVAQLRREGKLPAEGGTVHASSDSVVAAQLTQLIREVLAANREKKSDNSFESQALSKVIEMMSTASNRAVDMAMKQVKPEATATDQIVMLEKIMSFAEKMQPKPETKQDNGMLQFVMEELRDQRKRSDDLLKEILQSRRREPDEDEPKGMMKTVMETLLTRALDGMGEGGGGSNMKWWQEQMPMFLQEGNKAIAQLADLARMLIFRGAVPMPGAGPAAGNPGNPPPAGALPPAVPADKTGPGGPMNPLIQILNECTGPLILHLKSDTLTGQDFAEWFIYGADGTGSGGYGPRMFDQLKIVGKEPLLQAVKGFPVIAEQIKDVSGERVNEFLDEFFSGPREDDGDGEPLDPEPAGPQVVPPPARGRRAKKGE